MKSSSAHQTAGHNLEPTQSLTADGQEQLNRNDRGGSKVPSALAAVGGPLSKADLVRGTMGATMSLKVEKGTRHRKIVDIFGEYVVCNRLSCSGFKASVIDHTGVDLIAYDPEPQTAVSRALF